MNKAQKTRLTMIIIGLVIAIIALYLAADGLKEEASLFQSPTEIQKLSTEDKATKHIRLGGFVYECSLKTLEDGTNEFKVTDYNDDITVRYKGILPDLFREGQGVYIDGKFVNDVFIADEVLAKHDETYTPPMPGEDVL